MAYKKWDLVWVYWIFDNKIKEEIEYLENNLILYKNKIKSFIENAKNIKEITEKKLINNNKIHNISDDGLLFGSFTKDEILEMMVFYLQETDFPHNIEPLTSLSNELEKIISKYIDNIFKENSKKLRPAVIFHKSNENYWVMLITTTNLTNFNEKFDVILDDRGHIKCGSMQRIHQSFIINRISINNENKISNIDLQNKIIEKFTWFFLK